MDTLQKRIYQITFMDVASVDSSVIVITTPSRNVLISMIGLPLDPAEPEPLNHIFVI